MRTFTINAADMTYTKLFRPSASRRVQRSCRTDALHRFARYLATLSLVAACSPDAARLTEPKDVTAIDRFEGAARASHVPGSSSLLVWRVLDSDGAVIETQFGLEGDVPVPADYDGDGRTDFAVFRASSSAWWTRLSSDGTTSTTTWGTTGDIPVTGDFDGDGRADYAIFRPSSGQWWVSESSGGSSVVPWGLADDLPVAADYNGDGITDRAVFRPANRTWYVMTSGSSPDLTVLFGLSDDVPVPADYTGDGIADIAVYRPDTHTWYVLPTNGGGAVSIVTWGIAGDIPVPADYDGDGKSDLAVYRPSTGEWWVQGSSWGTFTATNGNSSDLPKPGRYLADPSARPTVLRIVHTQEISVVAPASAPLGSAVTVSASGGGSGNPVLITSNTPEVCTVGNRTGDDTDISLLSLGECELTATQDGNEAYLPAPSVTVRIAVVYPFALRLPTLPPPTLNAEKAGTSVTVHFAVGGNLGMNIFAVGSPASQQVSCTNPSTELEPLAATTPLNGNGLSFNPGGDFYKYTWRTTRLWAGTCRRFVLTLRDGASYSVYYRF